MPRCKSNIFLIPMPNYKLDELLSMPIDEIRSIAQSLGVTTKSSDSLQDIAYMIIDEQAVVQSKTPTPKPKRQRTTKTATTSTKTTAASTKKKTESKKKAEETASETEEKPVKKRTTRRRKTDEPATAEPKADEAATPQTAEPANNNINKVEETTAAAPAETEPAKKTRKRVRKTTAEETPAEPAETTAVEPAPETVETLEPEPKTEPTPEEPLKTIEPETDFIILQDIPPLEPEEPSYGPVESRMADDDETNSFAVTQRDGEQAALQTRGAQKATEPVRTSNQPYDFGDSIVGRGVLDITSEGQAFLRSADYNYLSSPDDIFVSNQQIKLYGLKVGDVVECCVRAPRENEKYFPLTKVLRINGLTPEQVRDRLSFEHLTPLFPNEKFRLCKGDGSDSLSARIVDLFAPIGKGQRALLVAQPKTGKTMLMKSIANAIAANHPEAYLMMLLIDERPEEVTDMARTVNAEVIASTFDEPASNHVKIAGIVLEKAKRMVECGHDVVIFLDSITRLARAYNTVAPASGKILTGGVDANALQKPKRFFGAARNIEGGGSLTIIATALIDTGSKMDEVIFEEFKGTGNMELQLDRTLSNKRIFPAVNCMASSTRRDDLLHDKMTLDRMWVLRNHIAEMTSMESMNVIRGLMEKTKNNEEFLLSMNS